MTGSHTLLGPAALGALWLHLGGAACSAPPSPSPLPPLVVDAGVPSVVVGCDPAELIAAIKRANAAGAGPQLITLAAGCVYTLTQPDNWWYGPTALPAIASDITIEGNGATLERSSASGTPAFRLFYVAGPTTPAALSAPGALTLKNVVLRGGLAQGGQGAGAGGGGAGLGGALLVQGRLTLQAVTLVQNRALGGSGSSGLGGGGGGLGGSGAPSNGGGGGFQVATTGDGGDFQGGEGGKSSGPGGVGSGPTPGQSTTGRIGGTGGGGPGLGGGGGLNLGVGAGGAGAAGDGGGGAGNIGGGGGGGAGGSGGSGGNGFGLGGGGGGFGGGGAGCTGNGGGGGGGGFGGGGGGCDGGGGGSGGGGGFGGGGGGGRGSGSGSGSGGSGGFGGGGGGSNSTAGGAAGFGGGNGGTNGGGGMGAGGAIFVLQGTVTLANSTLTANTAQGAGGSGLGGGLFNLNGSVTVVNSTLFGNSAAGGQAAGGAIYNLALGSGAPMATLTLQNTILAASNSGTDLYNQQLSGTARVDLTAPNLVQRQQNAGGTVLGQPTLSGDPTLGPLGDNGGPTPTFQPSATSIVFGAGAPALCTAAPVGGADQRGRRRDARGCSLGAYDTAEGLGAGCADPADCSSGFCTDGVCCDTACGGSDPGDCQACSQALGAPVDGTCALLGAATVCRPASDLFDPAEVCPGSDPVCPADITSVAVTRGSGGGISCALLPGSAYASACGPLAALLFLLLARRRRGAP